MGYFFNTIIYKPNKKCLKPNTGKAFIKISTSNKLDERGNKGVEIQGSEDESFKNIIVNSYLFQHSLIPGGIKFISPIHSLY